MKKTILGLLLMAAIATNGQGITYQGSSGNTIINRGVSMDDSLTIMALRDTTFPASFPVTLRKTGAMAMKGTVPYYYNGTKWVLFSSGIGYMLYVDTAAMLSPYLRKVDTATISARINLKVNYTDTATMLSPYLRKVDTPAFSNALMTNTPMSSTLDTVYRNGVNSSLHLSTVGAKILSNGIGSSITYSLGTGLNLANYTSASLGSQQYSPVLWFEGQGWKTNPTAASQSVRFGLYTATGQSTAAPFGNLTFYSQIDNGTEYNAMFLRSNGILTVDSALVVTDGTIDIAGVQSINTGTYHGIHNDAGFTSTGASDWKGYWMSGTVTQTGGGSGITRGIYLNPTLTNTADYRGIELTNTVGKSIVTGTAPSTFGGVVTLANGAILGTPASMTATNITGTASGLTAGNVTTNANLTGVVTSVGNATSFATSPAFTGNVTATNTTDITLGAESAIRIGGAANSTNMTGGEFSVGTGLQSRNNGATAPLYLNPLGNTVAVGDGSMTGQRLLSVTNSGTGTGDWAAIEIRNVAATAAASLHLYTMSTGFTPSGMNKANYGVVAAGSSLAGLSIGTKGAGPMEIWTNGALRATIESGGNVIHVTRVQFGKGANVASAGDITLGSAGNTFSITGTTTINAINTTSWQAGSEINLIFAGVLTLKNNTAGGAGTAKILTRTGADITTAANMLVKLIYDGTNWIQPN